MTDFTRSTYNSRNNYNDLYPEYTDIKEFDLHRKHFLYGRIDRDGNAIYLNDANLDQIYTGEQGTEFALDFVCDAFDFLKNYVRKLANTGGMQGNSLFRPLDFRVEKAWRSGDLEYSYYRYLNRLYTDFVQNYLEVNRRFEEITDFDSFLKSFSKYMASIAYYFPLTKTGYILSYHCSPFISGMMVEVAPERHGLQYNKRAIEYTTDANFLAIKNAAKKFGFMMDRNAPWRLVFNVASGGLKPKYDIKLAFSPSYKNPMGTKILSPEKELSGAKYFMANYGVSFEKDAEGTPFDQKRHVFDAYFTKAHMEEIENLRNYLFLFYSAFYTQFSTYTKIEVSQRMHMQMCSNMKLKVKYINRKELPGMATDGGALYPGTDPHVPRQFNDSYGDQFWLNYILKFRLLETATPHDISRYKFFQKRMHDTFNVFGTKAALNYINDLTKGFFATKFISEGEHWYGEPSKSINEARKESALANVGSDAFELVGTLNKPR